MKNKLIFLIFLIFFSINNVSSETLIYDNISSSNYKTIQITDDMNNIITDYKYDVYLDNSLLGRYAKNELIFIPNNSNITIYVPNTVNSNLDDNYSTMKTLIGYIVIFSPYIIFSIVGILVLRFLIKKR